MKRLAVTLPHELLFDCLDYAAVHPQNILLHDYRCLRNLSLVCKQVSRYAQKVLFHSVYLAKNRHALAFGSALNPGTEKGRWLASLVHTLKAQVRNDRGGLTQQLFIAALLACPNLHELDLDITNAGFDMSPFSTVFIERASPIQALRIAAPLTSAIAPAFLRVFPSLKFVEFKQAVNLRALSLSTPACQLAELHWRGAVNEVLHWCLQSSVGVLEILGLPPGSSSEIEDGQFERLLLTHGASLRSLHVSTLSDAQAFSLRHCTQLEEFIYDGIVSEAVLGRLPETIEHLHVQSTTPDFTRDGYAYYFSPQLIHYIETAPSLLTVTWIHETSLMSNRLEECCERRGIVWRTWMQPYGTYPGEKQELGFVETFPRPVSLSPSRTRELASARKQQEELLSDSAPQGGLYSV